MRRDAATKVKDDYHKRTSQGLPAGFVRATTTYVAVVAQIWDRTHDGTREAFVRDAKASGAWADVLVIDAIDLAAWLERCLGTAAWFRTHVLGQALPAGIENLEDWWELWRHRSRPPLQASMLLADRAAVVPMVRERLLKAGDVIPLQADSPEEAMAFAVATVLEEPEEDRGRELVLARGLIVSSPEAIPQIPADPRLCIFARNQVGQNADGLARKGHTVVLPLGNAADHLNISSIRLNRMSRAAFASSLVKAGLDPAEAEKRARESGASITVFQRRWPGGAPQTPGWATGDRARLLVPLALLGAWDESQEEDLAIVSRLAGMSYDDYARRVTALLSEDDPPIVRHGSVWALPAPVDVFALAERLISTPDLESFRVSVHQVLSEEDKRFTSSDEVGETASLGIRRFSHSEWLRKGLAECVLRIAVIGDNLHFPRGLSAKQFVNGLVEELPGLSGDPRVMAGLADQLTSLAEAAPDPFLDALESVMSDSEFSRAMFRDSKDRAAFLSTSPHTSVLSALETIAWDAMHLRRVCNLLVELHRLDPGGQYSNRPLSTLREILLPWRPGTSADVQERLQIIDDLATQDEATHWQLLVALVPTNTDMSHGTHRPLWRDWASGADASRSRSTLSEEYRQLFRRMIGAAGIRAERWDAILHRLGRFAPEDRKSALLALEKSIKSTETAEEQLALWRIVDRFVRRHRRFAGAAWAMPEGELASVETIRAQLTPPSAVDRWEWLFEQHLPDLELTSEDAGKQMAEVERCRRIAIHEIRSESGDTQLLSLVDRLQYPGLASTAVLAECEDIESALSLVEAALALDRGGPLFGSLLSAAAFDRFGTSWVEALFHRAEEQHWTAPHLAGALRWLPDTEVTIAILQGLGPPVQEAYWKLRDGWIRTENDEVLNVIVQGLLDAGRSWEVIQFAAHGGKQIKTALLVGVLHSALTTRPTANLDGAADSVAAVLAILSKREDADPQIVARLEYCYLPALRFVEPSSPLMLHRLLATDPAFFVQVLSDIYRADDEDRPSEVSADSKRRAEAGWELLQGWSLVPGSDDSGAISTSALREWVLAAIKAVGDARRRAIGEQHIGRVLAHSPSDADDSFWPHMAVRTVLQELATPEIESGLRLEQFNMRGVHSRALFEGGRQETDLAVLWRERAEHLQARWPRVAAICLSIASMWYDEARREDERAEQDKLRWGN